MSLFDVQYRDPSPFDAPNKYSLSLDLTEEYIETTEKFLQGQEFKRLQEKEERVLESIRVAAKEEAERAKREFDEKWGDYTPERDEDGLLIPPPFINSHEWPPDADELEWHYKSWYDEDNLAADEIYKSFISTMRGSLFVRIYSILESYTLNRCNLVECYNETPYKLEDTKGEGIEQAKEFLKKAIGVKLGDIKLWEKLRAYQAVRNTLAHSLGRLKESQIEDFTKKVKVFSKSKSKPQNDVLTIDNDNVLVLDEKLCLNFVEDVKKFMEEVNGELADWWDSQGYKDNKQCE